LPERYVLDSYAILALLQDEQGAERVKAVLREAQAGQAQAAMSLINLGEVAYIVERRWGQTRLRDVLAYLTAVPLQIIEAAYPQTLAAAHLKANYPLSYADAFAAALAQELDATLLTADPEFTAVAHLIQIEWLDGER
jgi:predicted nucleic acid-binding protein